MYSYKLNCAIVNKCKQMKLTFLPLYQRLYVIILCCRESCMSLLVYGKPGSLQHYRPLERTARVRGATFTTYKKPSKMIPKLWQTLDNMSINQNRQFENLSGIKFGMWRLKWMENCKNKAVQSSFHDCFT